MLLGLWKPSVPALCIGVCVLKIGIRLAAVAAVPMMLAAAPAWANGQSTTPPGSAFAGACSGVDLTGGFAQAGDAPNGGVSSGGINCATSTALNASAFSNASGAVAPLNYPFSTDAQASAGLGTLHLKGISHGSAATQFSGSQAVAGWNDTVTISAPAGFNNGDSGVWQVQLSVDGGLSATGPGADSQFSVVVLKNHSVLQPYGAAINGAAYALFAAAKSLQPPTDVYYGFDYQMVPFRETQYGSDKLLTLNGDLLTFEIPVVYGTPFTLGVYSQISVGSGSSGGFTGGNVATADFADTVSWDGKGKVFTNDGAGPATTSFTVANSSSGFNYNLPAAPEPGSWVLAMTGLALAGASLRRRRTLA